MRLPVVDPKPLILCGVRLLELLRVTASYRAPRLHSKVAGKSLIHHQSGKAPIGDRAEVFLVLCHIQGLVSVTRRLKASLQLVHQLKDAVVVLPVVAERHLAAHRTCKLLLVL